MKQVKLHLDHELITGILIKEDESLYTIKLASGYNIGIKKSEVKRLEELPSDEKIIAAKKTSNQNTDLPKILILHTGGTIASKIDYTTGAVVAQFEPTELIELFPELRSIARIESKLFRNMMSDDMRFIHYNLIAKEVESQLKAHPDLKGIIITHGTDTLHYTSCALSFIFEHLPIPIVLVGSQRSSDRGSSDSAINLICAAAFIANTTLNGVFICMHESHNDDACSILNGVNARKMHSSRRDAFKPINTSSIARINYVTREIEYLNEYPKSVLTAPGVLKIHPFTESLRIGFVISHPNMHAQELLAYQDFDGVVLEGTGLGHMPISEMDEYTHEHVAIRNAIHTLCAKMPVVMSVQTIYGRVNMNVYSPGRQLQELGVLGNQSIMTPETAFIKLAWLLSQELDPKEYFMKDLRGELSGKSIDFE